MADRSEPSATAKGGGAHAAVAQVAQRLQPRADVFAVAVDDGDQFLAADGAHTDDHQRTQAIGSAAASGRRTLT